MGAQESIRHYSIPPQRNRLKFVTQLNHCIKENQTFYKSSSIITKTKDGAVFQNEELIPYFRSLVNRKTRLLQSGGSTTCCKILTKPEQASRNERKNNGISSLWNDNLMNTMNLTNQKIIIPRKFKLARGQFLFFKVQNDNGKMPRIIKNTYSEKTLNSNLELKTREKMPYTQELKSNNKISLFPSHSDSKKNVRFSQDVTTMYYEKSQIMRKIGKRNV